MNQLYDQYFGHTIGHIGFITNNITSFLSEVHVLQNVEKLLDVWFKGIKYMQAYT